jgi:Protein of unknown function (DUF3298)
MAKKTRTEIPAEVAAEALFLSDRTCCICRESNKPVQIHHIDENPGNSVAENLAVLCFDCHHLTQLRGGFDRKLDAAQVLKYRADWLARVASKRDETHGPLRSQAFPGKEVIRVIKISEASEDAAYSFDAEYPQLPDGSSFRAETNLCIAAFVTQIFQRFRALAIDRTTEKAEMRNTAFASTAHDELGIGHKLWMFSDDLLSVELVAWTYYAGAVHPNSETRTLSFRLNPPMQIQLRDIFASVDHVEWLSKLCIEDLHKQQPLRFGDPDQRKKELEVNQDDWILRGAGPDRRNFEAFVLTQEGLRIFFDPYRVGSYAEGRYEVLVPYSLLTPLLKEDIKLLLKRN